MSTTRNLRLARGSFVTSSSKYATSPAVCTVAACTRSCVIGTKTVPSGTRTKCNFAAVWRRQPKWVVSRTLKSVGPSATLVEGDIEAVIRGLRDERAGEMGVGGPELARSLANLSLIDEYGLYVRPVVLGRGKPFFASSRAPLRLVASELIGEDAVRLTYVPA